MKYKKIRFLYFEVWRLFKHPLEILLCKTAPKLPDTVRKEWILVMFNFFMLLADGEGATQAAADTAEQAAGGGWMSMLPMLALYAVIFGAMWFFMIRPNSKKKKEEAKMRENVQVGDAVTTIGGIMGRVVSVKEDSLLLETGADRAKVRIKKWAIQSNETIHDDAE